MPRLSPTRKLLVVSPHWLPVNAPDLQRVRTSLRAYRALGWEPTVLAVRPDDVDAPRDPELAASVPDDVRVERVIALPLALTRQLGLRSLALRAAPALHRRARELLARERFDLVLMSHTQFAVMPLARLWRAEFGVPFVVDLQDPWRTDYYQRPGSPPPPGGWKFQFARLQAAALEAWTFRAAAGFMSVSPAYLDALAARYAWFAGKPTAVIPFGASPDDLRAALASPLPVRTDGRVHIVSTGAAGPIMRRSLETLFNALAALRRDAPSSAARLRLHFVGTSYAPPAEARESVRPLAEAAGVGDLVDEQPARIGLLASLREQARADAVLILGSDDPAYTPSKLFGAALTGRPLVVVAPAASRLAQLVADWPGVTVAASDAAGERVLEAFFERATVAGGLRGDFVRPQVEPFLVDALAARQTALFAAATGVHSRERAAFPVV